MLLLPETPTMRTHLFIPRLLAGLRICIDGVYGGPAQAPDVFGNGPLYLKRQASDQELR